VGEYTILEAEEPVDISEKKVMNIISLLNGREDLIDLSHMVETRLLFSLIPRTDAESPTKILFRTHDGVGVSKENALLSLQRGILNEQDTVH